MWYALAAMLACATHALRSATPRAVRRCAPLSAGRASAAVSQKEQAPAKPETQAALDLNPPRGTRDFYPEELRVRNWLFGQWRATAAAHGFEEYDSPVLESEALYVRKAGEEVTQQLYNFEDKGGRRVALRPEMTPSLARMVMARKNALPLPVKWFSVPQCWRYERTTRGRRREHYQWNMDIWGVPGVTAEAEVLAAVVGFFERVGIDSADVGIKINSRRVLSAILAMYGVTGDKFAEVCVIVDKLDKIGPDATVELLMATPGPALGDDAAKKIVQSLSLKSIKELSALTGDLGNDAVAELTTLFEVAEAYGFADWILFDASVVRGLAYYTGIVFEGFDRKGELRAICGGGRYDKLLSLYGSPTVVPACGFGFGDCVVMELLREKGVLPTLTPNLDFVVVAFNNEMRLHAVGLAAQLRGAGFAVDVLLAPKKHVDKAFSYADRVDGRRVVFVAPDEWAQKKVRVKDLRAPEDDPNKQVDLPVDGFVDALAAMGVRPN